MRKNIFSSFSLFIVLFCLFVYSLLSSGTCFAQSTNSNAIKIGVIQSLTGIAAEDGKTVVQALQLAAEEINSHGLHKVQLLVEDDGTLSRNTASAFEKLAAQGVDAVIGATWDFTTNAVLPLAGQKHMVLFNTSAPIESLDLTSADGYAFTNAITTAEGATAFARYLDRNKTKTIAIVFTNNAWGEAQLKVYKEIAASRGAEVLSELRSTSYDANEWHIFVTKMRQKKADLIVLLLNKNDLTMFLRRSNEQGLKTNFFASKNLYDAWRTEKARNLFNGVCFTYPMEQLGNEAAFRENYKKKFDEDPRIYADNTYDALFIIAAAYEQSKKRGVSLKEALREVAYKGIVGTYKYKDETSLSLGQSSLVCVENGGLAVKQ